MNYFSPKTLLVVFVLMLSACGGKGPDGLTVMPNGDLVVAQGTAQKGPFVAGSTVTLNVLNSSTTTSKDKLLGQNGRSFTLETNKEGVFPTNSIVFNANEKFIQAAVQGYYFDEIEGTRSSDYISLRGIFDINQTAMNVNVLTHMAHARILKLAVDSCGNTPSITSPCAIADLSPIINRAEREVLAAFNIPIEVLGSPQKRFGDMSIKNIANANFLTNTDQDQVLLAISSLVMQIGQEGSGVTEFLSAFVHDIASDGVLDDLNLKAQIARASATVNFSKVAKNMNFYYGTSAYVSKDLQRWIDPSGGVVGVISNNTDYFSVTSSILKYTSKTINFQSSKNSCLLLTSQEATSKIIPTNGTAFISSNTAFYVAANTPYSFTIESTLNKDTFLKSRTKLVSWDQPSTSPAGSCSSTAPSNNLGIYYFAATPPGFNNFANQFISNFSTCFNLSVTNRVRQVDLTNPNIPNVKVVNPLCEKLAGSPVVNYLHNGYKAGEQFYWMLSDPAMTKTARITEMDVIDYYIGKNAEPTAKVLFSYVDRYNNKGSFVVLATQNASYSSDQNSGWYNVGNQQVIDINLMTGVRKITTMPVFANATLADMKVSYRTAFLPIINNDGPGVVLPDGKVLTAVKIRGPGLPTNGLVYIKPIQEGQSEFDFSNLEGTLPDGRNLNQLKRCGIDAPIGGFSSPPAACPLNWVGMTPWIAPNRVDTINSFKVPSYPAPTSFAQNNPIGFTWLSSNTGAVMLQGTEYEFSLYYDNGIQPTFVYTKRLNTSMPSINDISSMSWVSLSNIGGVSIDTALSQVVTTTSPLNLSSLTPKTGIYTTWVSWNGQIQNVLEISQLNAALELPFTPRATPGDSVARGYNNGIISPQLNQNGNPMMMQWHSTNTDGNPSTDLQTTISLSYRTWNGSWKSQDYQFESIRR